MAPLLSQKRGTADSMEGTTPSSLTNFRIQIASLAASDAAMYSASVVESAVILYLELFQLTAPPLQVKTNPEIDFLSSTSDWKSESVKPVSCKSPPP